MTLSVAGSNSTAAGKRKRYCGSRLFTRRRAFAMSGLASTVCWPHFDNTLRVPDQIADRPSLGVEDAHPMVAPVGNIYVAIRIHGYIRGVIECIWLRIPGILRMRRHIRPEHGLRRMTPRAPQP